MAPGYHSVNPYFLVAGVEDFIEFLAEVFGGREETKFKEVRPDGLIDHADVVIGDSIVMMSDADPTTRHAPRSHSCTSRMWTRPMRRHSTEAVSRDLSLGSLRGESALQVSLIRGTTGGG